jgi:hypothetical protein
MYMYMYTFISVSSSSRLAGTCYIDLADLELKIILLPPVLVGLQFCFVGLEFELKASHLQSWCSATPA